ncbi:MAG: ribose-phosphate pyrophosphokinase, partial [Dehalococcoidia bacterium]|nr:ribose-phosphate pyrophosphokinase [Dehalococcoidia bacterium]
TAVIPYYGYGRSDKKDQPRVPITARLLADLLTVAGANRVLTIDLHAGQIQGFFNIPVDELTAFPILARYYKDKRLTDAVVVAVDIGISKRARDVAERLGVPLAIVEKRRVANNAQSELLNIIGDVRGRTAILVDDEVLTGGSMLNAVTAVKAAGALKVYACCSHGLLPGNAPQRIMDGPIEELVLTDTIQLAPEKRDGKIVVISIADLLGEAIRRIHSGLSVGAMFEDKQWAALAP